MVKYVRQSTEGESKLPPVVKKLAQLLLEGLENRFSGREANELVSQAILLDPRFKKQGFSEDKYYQAAYQSLLDEMESIKAEDPVENQPPKLNNTESTSIWKDFDEITSKLQASSNPKVAARVEIDKYISEPLLTRTGDPILWWKERKSVYPTLFGIMLGRLCIPATSVPCERIFSKTGQICTEKRSRLTSKNVEKIIFVKHNM